jgi:hypothetical protein
MCIVVKNFDKIIPGHLCGRALETYDPEIIPRELISVFVICSRALTVDKASFSRRNISLIRTS